MYIRIYCYVQYVGSMICGIDDISGLSSFGQTVILQTNIHFSLTNKYAIKINLTINIKLRYS